MGKILVSIARILVGLLFIISGLIKLNDPVGFSFKLEEYFSPGVLNLDFLTPYALAIAIVIVVFETLLGVMLLLGFKPKFTTWSLLLMILFFTFLTFYSAYYNKVTDCGCFGDAIKLTPWQSFSKDIVLLFFILILFFGRKHISTVKFAKSGTFIALALCIIYVYYVYNHLPVIDFRPYKIGANIMEGIQIPENAPKAIYEYAWKFKVNGEEKVITTNGDYPTVDGEFIDVKTTEIQKGYEPPIHDFTMEIDGEDHTEEIMDLNHVLVIVSRVINEADEKGLQAIKKVAEKAKEKGYRVIGLSASNPEQIALVKENYGLDFDFYFCDLTTVKTIIRSNPALLELQKGTITQKLHYNDADEFVFSKDVVKQPEINTALKKQLDSIYRLDQGIREIYYAESKAKKDSIAKEVGIEVQEEVNDYMDKIWPVIDSTNMVAVDKIIDQYGYPGKSLVGEPTDKIAWFVIQHSPKIEEYLPMLRKEAEKGELPKRLMPLMEDRYLMRQGKMQIYGTQGSYINTAEERIPIIWPIKDPENVNTRRKEAGLDTTVEEYGKNLFGDDFEYEVLTLEEMKKMEE
ncbi:BT_3928 family protein [Galbibacter sp. PAP.153]|uniref:BT_3928 family protein n=1 Tax=Galbibacter sp. PAP.153 TaxID=3104623 RepID=UPI003008B10F